MKLQDKNKSLDNLVSELKDLDVPFWIDSSGGPSSLCNKSMYGGNPKYIIYGSLNQVYFVDEEANSQKLIAKSQNFFEFLEEKINKEKDNPNGILVGYLSYDLGSKEQSYPSIFFAYYNSFKETSAVFHNSHSASCVGELKELRSNMTDDEYLEKVKKIKEEIREGNVYQVNLTREYSLDLSISEFDLYLKLREASPNPYGCYFKTPQLSILSSSPEEFLSVDSKSLIQTRPIKGTLQKGENKIDPKNSAENLMIVDLERNDLGRICETGSVEVKKLLEVEEYEHLNHVVSTVQGKLKEGTSLREIFEATFPGGSITGAPKIAAMKIINQIEPTPRGAYTGSFGYIKTSGEMSFNILIRSMFVSDSKITFNVGGGIVADSDPVSELEETKVKSKGILQALGLC